jgi:hypothetical protein
MYVCFEMKVLNGSGYAETVFIMHHHPCLHVKEEVRGCLSMQAGAADAITTQNITS